MTHIMLAPELFAGRQLGSDVITVGLEEPGVATENSAMLL